MLPLFRLLARLPLAWLHAGGVVIGWITYLASPVYAARMRHNLEASGLYPDPRAFTAALRRCIAETGKGAVEIIKVWFGELRDVKALVETDTLDVIEAARAEGRGILFLTPHLGCFEMSGLYTGEQVPLTALYRPPRQRWLEPLMRTGRTRSGGHVAPANLRGVRTLYKALQRGESVGVLPDQAPQMGEGVWAPFFGRPAYTMTLVRRLQKQTGAAVIFVVAERLPRGRGFRLLYQRYKGSEIDEATMNREIEALIRRCPTQYLWSYNRYKVPAGAQLPAAVENPVP